MKAAFLIAAPASGSGKTTVARGLMALLRQQGFRVQPFKCGPDYIDTKFHEQVCGRPSVNLDTFMSSVQHVRELFARYTSDADVAVVEGMMGLFDGYDRDRGSCSEVARVLGLPVVLVVDARSAAYSMAALLQGFLRFRKDLYYAGVLFNKVGSPRHQQMLREVAAEVGLPCLGCIPKQDSLEQGSRYLGLDFSEETNTEGLVRVLSENLDLPMLLTSATCCTTSFHLSPSEAPSAAPSLLGYAHSSPWRILVARNAESFSFLYAETLDALRQLGDVEFFDPEEDMLPAGGTALFPFVPTSEDLVSFIRDGALADSLLYLPGGYPEKHLPALVRAEAVRRFVHAFAEAGGRIIAECGGMMYLCRSILTEDGEFPMCGVLPHSVSARRADRRLSLGYRRFQLDGHELRGHEFHYTQFASPAPDSAAQVYNAKGEPVATQILRWGNVLASYTHLSPEAIVSVVRARGLIPMPAQ
jgi:cobyrinic acid a,c-diamide synthase